MGVPGASVLKNLPANARTQVQSLGPEEPLEEEMATHSDILAWEIPWTEEPGRLQSTGSQRVEYGLATQQQDDLRLALSFASQKASTNASHAASILAATIGMARCCGW